MRSGLLPFSLFLALKYLRPKRSFLSVVTFISVAGVLLGVAILVIVLSVMTGFDNMWRSKILSFKPHLTVTAPGGVIEEVDDVCDRIGRVPGVTGVTPVIELRVMMQHSGRLAAPILLGVDPVRAAGVSQIPAATRFGRFHLEDESCVLGIDLAAQLGAGPGDRVLAHSPLSLLRKDEVHLPAELRVEGLFEMGMRDFDGMFALTSLDVARDLVDLDRGAYALYVMTDDPFRFAERAAAVSGALGPDYEVRTWREVDRLLFEALSHEKTMMFLLLLFITIVAIFCVTNTLIVVTVHKTREIGLLKALGFPPGAIMWAFVWHGWIQCMAGTALGIGAGLLVLHNLSNIVRALTLFDVRVFPKEIYGLGEIPWHISAGEVFQIAAFVMAFCTLSSFLPARRAARLDPVEALRHE